jgi:hypothetical protein
MSDLLAEAVEALGGLERWKQFSVVEANLSVGGAIWDFKGQPGLFEGVIFRIGLLQEMVTVDRFSGNARLSFTPDRLTLETLDGEPILSRENPRGTFAGHRADTPGTNCTQAISAATHFGPT